MNRRRTIRFAVLASGALATLLAWSLPVLAQCAMCKNAVTGSPEAAKLSQSLNFAVIVLLIPPVLIFCGIFVVAFRYRKSREAELNTHSDGGDRSGEDQPSSAETRRKKRSGREPGGALA